ncbi:MAG: glycosyltransferase family 4 protein [Bacteroidales bacterium]|nr:glycosyltransferase family 4 protein [Bacteroidales bacterium]MCF8337145.1 glycosyltransferase family 4 protein [Bacteroidales bacterium]
MNKVLVVTYYWPPHSGTGTYRISKFVKYLVREGWEPIILTPENPVSAFKEKKVESVFQNVKVYRTKILEPTFFNKKNSSASQNISTVSFLLSKELSFKQKIIRWIRLNLFIPDAKILWLPFAVKEGKKVILKEKPDIIFSTSPPPSAQMVAKKLAKWGNLKWVADFRDPWTNIFYYELLKFNPLSKNINNRLEKKVLKAADKIITVSNNFFPDFNQPQKHIQIENGFDPDDIASIESFHSKKDKFTIRYIGSLKSNQFFKNFVEILKELIKEKRYQKNIKFEVAGYVEPAIKAYMEKELEALDFNIQEYVPHEKAIRKMAEADLLILAIGKGAWSKNVISTKIFEYLMVGKPILAFGHLDGAANKILRETKAGVMFDYSSYEEVENHLLMRYSDWEANSSRYDPDKKKIKKYSFENHTKKLIKVMEDCLIDENC